MVTDKNDANRKQTYHSIERKLQPILQDGRKLSQGNSLKETASFKLVTTSKSVFDYEIFKYRHMKQ